MDVALYLRVSTKKQARQDLSIPDQSRQLRAYCKRKGWKVVREYVERGASATTQERPVFQQMLSDARQRPGPFSAIVVHSYSRFARDLMDSEFVIRMLAKQNIQLHSMTQELNDSPESQMIRRMMQMFDEYSSRENAKHTLRAMKENARQGFWNGSLPPFGYKVKETEKRGDKSKKKLHIDPVEAAVVRELFKLYVSGSGRQGPMGVKKIVSHLNARGRRQRNGKLFNIQFVHRMLRESAYNGTHYFNRRYHGKDNRKLKPKGEWVAMSCPAIVDRKIFEVAQKLLDERNPKKTPPRTVTNGILLGGLVRCGSCGGSMTLRVGKGGRYRYYACCNKARIGATACKGNVLPMPKLDALITDTLLNRVLVPERVGTLIEEMRKETKRRGGGITGQVRELVARERELAGRMDRLLQAVEEGTVRDRDSVRQRIDVIETSLSEVRREKLVIDEQIAAANRPLSPQQIARAIAGLSDLLRNGDLQLRKAYLRLFIETIEVHDGEIIVTGSRDAVAKAVQPPPGNPSNSVPVFVQEWRPRRDLNARPPH